MNFLSIAEWQDLAEKDYSAWERLVFDSLEACIQKTETSVVSAAVDPTQELMEGPLAGVPYGLKDLFDLAGYPTHCSSKMPDLVSRIVQMNSELVAKLATLGARCVAKTQMNEFAYGLSGENPHYGDCRHPVLERRLSGGSSSGSAHMVAGGYVPVAFGTDTGGSIRLPAAWCGLYGVRWHPNYFMRGAYPLAASFDTIGWFTRNAEDMQLMLRHWFDGEQSDEEPIFGSFLLPKNLVTEDACRFFEGFIAAMNLSTDESHVEMEDLLSKCNRAFNVLQSREAYALHADRLKRYPELYDSQVRNRIERGMEWTDLDVESAMDIQTQLQSWFEDYFARYDFLALPVCPGPAVAVDGASDDLREVTLRLTGPASLAQKPVLTVPIPTADGETLGVQFIFNETGGRVPQAILERCKNI